MPILVGTTSQTKEEAMKIAGICVEQGIAACAHVDEIDSIYMWKGEVVTGKEFRVSFKTSELAKDLVFKAIRENHSYDEPAMFVVPIIDGSASYLKWIEDNSNSQAV